MRPVLLLLLPLLLVSCSSDAPRAVPQTAEAKPQPTDEAHRFPQTGLVRMQIVSDHLLGKVFMPGGNLASYRLRKMVYQQFLGKLPDAQAAAFLLLDWKKALKDPKYLAHMGGFYGMDGGHPVYVFTKGAWIAGVTELPEEKADGIMREFAAHL